MIALLVVLLAIPVLFLFIPKLSAGLMVPTLSREVRGLVVAPEDYIDEKQKEKRGDLLKKISKIQKRKLPSSRLTLSKKLKYAQWNVSIITLIFLEIVISAALYSLTSPYIGILLKVFVICSGPIIIRALIHRAIERRFNAFDADYPQFLMSVVGLLKTGMSPMNAIEAAGNGLPPKSLVRLEVKKLIERMRMGISEERSIGLFADTIHHPETELFIQALLLSKRVGGALSDTLERLAKQARKRQYFRSSAVAAVSLQRASLWMIIVILVLLEGYIYFASPMLIVEAWNAPTGWLVWQTAILAVILSLFWIKEVTRIKV